MHFRLARFTTILVLVFASANIASALAPELPEYSVLDPTAVLSPGVKHALETMLIEHERLTQEHVVLAIFKDAEKSGPTRMAKSLVGEWKLGRGDPGRGILIAYFVRENEGRIETGFGFDTAFASGRAQEIINETLELEARAGHRERAAALATLEILRVIESPLANNGKAEELLREGGFKGDFVARAPHTARGSWIPWILFGCLLSLGAASLLTSAEAHYTSAGWIHPKPWDDWRLAVLRKLRRQGDGAPSVGGTHGSW